MASNNTVTKTRHFDLNTIARSQGEVLFIDFRDLEMGVRSDSNMNKIDTALYENFKQGLFVGSATTLSANTYQILNAAITFMFDQMAILFIADKDNATGQVKLQINNLPAYPVKKSAGSAYADLEVGDLKSKQPALLYFNQNENTFVLSTAAIPTGALDRAGIVQLSSSLNSESESLAATPKAVYELQQSKVSHTEKGANNGVAGLDSNGRVFISQIPSSLLDNLKCMGNWDASTGTSPLSPAPGNYWIISSAGILDGVSYAVNDWLICQSNGWMKLDQNYTADDITYTPSEHMSATTLQGAVDELSLGKVDQVAGMGLSEANYSPAEKEKLSGIETSANNYTLPIGSATGLGGFKVGTNLSVDSDGTLHSTGEETGASLFFIQKDVVVTKEGQVESIVIPFVEDFKTNSPEVLLQNEAAWENALEGIHYTFRFVSTIGLEVTFYQPGTYKVNYGYASTAHMVAEHVEYTNTESQLTATNIQSAMDEEVNARKQLAQNMQTNMAPLASPLFTGTPKVEGNPIATTNQLPTSFPAMQSPLSAETAALYGGASTVDAGLRKIASSESQKIPVSDKDGNRYNLHPALIKKFEYTGVMLSVLSARGMVDMAAMDENFLYISAGSRTFKTGIRQFNAPYSIEFTLSCMAGNYLYGVRKKEGTGTYFISKYNKNTFIEELDYNSGSSNIIGCLCTNGNFLYSSVPGINNEYSIVRNDINSLARLNNSATYKSVSIMCADINHVYFSWDNPSGLLEITKLDAHTLGVVATKVTGYESESMGGSKGYRCSSISKNSAFQDGEYIYVSVTGNSTEFPKYYSKIRKTDLVEVLSVPDGIGYAAPAMNGAGQYIISEGIRDKNFTLLNANNKAVIGDSEFIYTLFEESGGSYGAGGVLAAKDMYKTNYLERM